MGNATNRWLDRLAAADKAKGGTGTDYKLAQLLDLSPQRISRYRREADKSMGADVAVRLAELLEVHPRIVVAEIQAEQARDERERRYWTSEAKSALKKLGMLAPLLLSHTDQAEAAILTALHSPLASETARLLCILCKTAPANDPSAIPLKARQDHDGTFKRKPLPSFKRGRIVHLSELTVTPELARAA